MFKFCQLMFNLHNPIEGYVNLVITPEQYKEITGQDYAPAAATPTV